MTECVCVCVCVCGGGGNYVVDVVDWRCRLSVPRQKIWREFLQRKECLPPVTVSVKREIVKDEDYAKYGPLTQVLATTMIGVNRSRKWNMLY